MVNGIIGSSTGPPFLILSFHFLKLPEVQILPTPTTCQRTPSCVGFHLYEHPQIPPTCSTQTIPTQTSSAKSSWNQFCRCSTSKVADKSNYPLRITDSTTAWFCGSCILNKVGWFWCLMSLPIHMSVSVSRSEDKSNQNKFRPTVHQFDQPRDKWTISLVVPTPCLESASPLLAPSFPELFTSSRRSRTP